jgi:hypothetical protein
VTAFKSQDPHLTLAASLDRAFLTVINSDDGMKIGRTTARQMWGNGWKEARSSVVLAEAVARWLGKDLVRILAFWNNDGQQHVVASIGEYAISGEGITTVDDIFKECCRRYHTAPKAAHFEPLDAEVSGLRFTMGDVVAEQSIARLTTMLTTTIDREVALMVLDPGR